MKLIHYSSKTGLNRLLVSFHGTGIPGQEKLFKRLYPDIYVDRLYFYNSWADNPEAGLGPYRYVVDASALRIYGPKNSIGGRGKARWERASEMIADKYGNDDTARILAFQKLIRDEGFSGIDFGENGVILFVDVDCIEFCKPIEN